MVGKQNGVAFDPETVELLKECLETAWSRLEPPQQARTSKIALAERILKAAASGERDPIRLQARALIAIAPEETVIIESLSGATE